MHLFCENDAVDFFQEYTINIALLM